MIFIITFNLFAHKDTCKNSYFNECALCVQCLFLAFLYLIHNMLLFSVFQLCEHQKLEDLWMEHMLTVGLAILLDRMDPSTHLPVRYAVAQTLATLASYHNITMLLIDHGMTVINAMKNLNSDFKASCMLKQ